MGSFRFLADSMLGKTARWMRLLGYDVEYGVGLSDEELVERAAEEDRILLTSDLQLYRRAAGRRVGAYRVEGLREAERLGRVAGRFGLRLEVDVELSRCPLCNTPLKPAEASKVMNVVPKRTRLRFREFWCCPNPKCGKVYWQGSHWANIGEVLKEAHIHLQKRSKKG